MGFEKSMWTVTIDSARILLGAHIDDFVIVFAISRYLTVSMHAFWTPLRAPLRAPMRRLCNITSEVTRDMDKGTTYLSQTDYAEEILRTYNFWNAMPGLLVVAAIN